MEMFNLQPLALLCLVLPKDKHAFCETHPLSINLSLEIL